MPWMKYAAALRQWEELGRLSGEIRGTRPWSSGNRFDLKIQSIKIRGTRPWSSGNRFHLKIQSIKIRGTTLELEEPVDLKIQSINHHGWTLCLAKSRQNRGEGVATVIRLPLWRKRNLSIYEQNWSDSQPTCDIESWT